MGGRTGLKLMGVGILLVSLMAACGGEEPQPAPAAPTVAAPPPTSPPPPPPTSAPALAAAPQPIVVAATPTPVPATPTPVPAAPTPAPPRTTAAPAPTTAPAPTAEPTAAPDVASPPQLSPSDGPPHIFIGKASLDGTPAAPGTIVAAYILGQEVGQAIVGDDGKFPAIVILYHNQQVVFAIGGYAAHQVHPQTQAADATKLELTACTGGQPPGPPPPDPASAPTGC